MFGQGSRAPVAITILVRGPDAAGDGCRIFYRDVGDYLTREDKLERLREWGSIAGVSDWQEIVPDRHHDWIGQRDEAFQAFYPVGSKAAKAGKADDAVFRLYSRGLATSRDAYLYNFSAKACASNARGAIRDYMGAMEVREEHPEYTVDEATTQYETHIRWDRELKNNLRRRKQVKFSPGNVLATQYRPFVRQHCYVEYTLVNNKYQMDSIFPPPHPDVGMAIAPTDRPTDRPTVTYQ